MNIVIPILWFALLGGVFGVILAVASKLFFVKRDEREEKMSEILPGANCGGCGYAGCSAYAEAVAKGEAKVGLCTAGGSEIADKMAEVMGVTAEKVVRMRAVVMCSGTLDKSKKKYIYEGAPDCVSDAKMGGGDRLCPYGCMGFGSCAAVCPVDAIEVVNGVARVNPDKCVACGACVRICPKNLIKLVPYDSKFTVVCKSEDNGKLTRTYCEVGCIGCGICVKQCEYGAIRIVGGRAEIDYDKCVACGKCAEKCPRKIIRITAPTAAAEGKEESAET